MPAAITLADNVATMLGHEGNEDLAQALVALVTGVIEEREEFDRMCAANSY